MGFLDSFNVFKKKEDFILPPLDSQQQFQPQQQPESLHPELSAGHNFESGQFAASPPPQQMPLDDHRMNLPLGENIRQSRVSAMYGGEHESETHELRVNPLQKDLELISSKLDYLRASLDAINQRLVNIEHMARQGQETERRRF